MPKRKSSTTRAVLGLAAFAAALRRSGRPRQDVLAALGPSGPRTPVPDSSQAGRGADTPTDIAPQGWWAIIKRTGRKFSENELMSEAASVTFYALLSLVPALTATISLYAMVADPTTIAKQIDGLSGIVPSGGMQIIDEQVQRLVEAPRSGLSAGVILGLATALWSANAATKAMFSALNDVYGERESRGFLRLTATSLAFTFGGIVTMLLGAAVLVALPAIFQTIGFDSLVATGVDLLRIPLMLAVVVAALAVLFRFGPCRAPAKWRWVTPGGVTGAVAWILVSVAFSWYVAHFGSYNKTYGSLGALIGFMTWIWLSTTVLLLGAQLNAEMETQTEADTTRGTRKPIGQRGARAADTVS